MFSNYRAIGFVAASAGALLLAFLCARPALTDDDKGDKKRGDERGEAMFDRVDKDGNGAISREEFGRAADRLKHAMKRMRHEREQHASPKQWGESRRPVPHHDGGPKARTPGKHDKRPKGARGPHGHRGRPTIVHVHHHYYHPGGPPPHHAGPRHGPGRGPHHRSGFHSPKGPHTAQRHHARHQHDPSCNCQLCGHRQECRCDCSSCREAHCDCEACRNQRADRRPDDRRADATESAFSAEIQFEAADFQRENSVASDDDTTQETDSAAEVGDADPTVRLDITDIAGQETLAITTEGDTPSDVEISVAAEPETP